MLRTLAYHWRMNLAVVVGAATTTAVLVGALVVGDSVRGSLRDLTLERLGGIDHAVAAGRFFPEDLAARVAAAPALGGALEVAPAIFLEGSAEAADRGTRATGVGIQGVDERFLAFFPDTPPLAGTGTGGFYPPVWIDAALAGELGVAAGAEIVLSLRRWSAVPSGSLLGRQETEEVVERIRATVAGVLPDAGVGVFALRAHQTTPRNAFLPLVELQRELRQPDRVDGLVAGGGGSDGETAAKLEAALRGVLKPEDLGLRLTPGPGYLAVESDELILRPEAVAAVEHAAAAAGAEAVPILTYLANNVTVGEREIPYATVTALPLPPPPGIGGLAAAGGGALPAVGEDEVLLGTWAAGELAAGPGDAIELTYLEVGPREELRETTSTLRVAGVVERSGLAADRTLAQDVPGIADAENMADWDPPFPVELERVRPADEAYWDAYRATPKLFLPLATGQRLWQTRWGAVTALRLVPKDGDVAALRGKIAEALVAELPLAPFGLAVQPVKELGLAGAGGSSDFGGLFLGFSWFLIASAALLAALLFALGVEARAGEIGLLLALGYPPGRVRRSLLGEGLILASLGAVVGLAGALGYAAAVITGLGTWWKPAVGTSRLALHAAPATLAGGAVAAIVVVLAAIAFTVRRVGRVPAATLLRRVVEVPSTRPGRIARRTAAVTLGLAALLVGVALARGGEAGPALFFAVGPCVLAGGLAVFSLALAGVGRAGAVRPGRGAILRLALGNGGRSRGRSLLAATLVATAGFLIVAVAAFQVDPARGGGEGTGGFDLVAETDVPLERDLADSASGYELGLRDATSALLANSRVLPLRLVPGDDASCLNLYQPTRPRLVGVSESLATGGSFAFHATVEPSDDPWSLLRRDLGPGVVPVAGDVNSTQWILKLGLGDELEVEDEAGQPLRLRLVATLETSVFQRELLIDEEALLRHFPGRAGWQVFLVDAPEGKTAEVAAALEADLGVYGFDALPAGERLAAFHAVQNTYLSTFLTLGGLGLLLGTVGLAVVLARNVLERRPELAAMQAFGFRRATLTRMVVAENGVLLAAGLGIGTVAALVSVLPHLLDPAAAVPWGSIVATLAAILLFGLAAGAATAAAALRAPLLPALKADR